MTVAELIDRLCRVEDRQLPVICAGAEVDQVELVKVKQTTDEYGRIWLADQKGKLGVVLE